MVGKPPGGGTHGGRSGRRAFADGTGFESVASSPRAPSRANANPNHTVARAHAAISMGLIWTAERRKRHVAKCAGGDRRRDAGAADGLRGVPQRQAE